MVENPEVLIPTIPESIVVHLGPAEESAPNVRVGFIDYIANVASNEIYPTWPENALIANMIAQISFALNRYYTESTGARGMILTLLPPQGPIRHTILPEVCLKTSHCLPTVCSTATSGGKAMWSRSTPCTATG